MMEGDRQAPVLTTGTRLGPYEITGSLGAGGMGEVYRARDPKLNRDVAIKVLLPSVVKDPDRLARFSREAQVLASLNHPNIAHIHGFEDSGATHALVMELVEGPTLAERVALGPIPVAEALPIARQIADALEAAHEQGIIHRDLKPANIKVRPDGTVKVLDFGLAKAMDPAGASSANVMNSPTLSVHATQAGVILGTAAYMSPEQAAGKPVDKRSDLWAFGVVLLEMLSGRQVFGGETISHVLAAVLKDEPEWAGLPAQTPAPIRRLLRRCLEKDRRRRLDSAAAARLEIDDALTTPPDDVKPTKAANRWLRLLPWAVAAATTVIAAALAWGSVEQGQQATVYATLDAPAGFVLGTGEMGVWPSRTPMVFTADGRSLIIQAGRDGRSQLFVRSLDRPDARPIAGTSGAHVPFVSPDGKWIGFWAANELRKVPTEGGTATTICPLTAGPFGPFGAAWGAADVIVFGDDVSGRLMRVSASGGTPVGVTAQPPAADRRRHVGPVFLPDGQRLLFSDVSTANVSDSRLMLQSLAGGDARLVVASATDGRLLPTGGIAFMRLGTLMTVAFDATRAEVIGDPVAAMSEVMQGGMLRRAGATNPGAGMFAVSGLGSLAVVRGPVTSVEGNSLSWVGRDGRSSSAEPASGGPPGARWNTRLSPDGSRAIVTVQTPTRLELWLADWTRNVWTPCGDCDADLGLAVWSPDSRRLLLGRKGTLVAHAIDGSVPDQVMVREPDRSVLPMAWGPDGAIVYLSSPDLRNYEIKYQAPGDATGRVIVPLGKGLDADVSRDGRWLAYTSRDTGQGNVVVQPVPGPGSRTQVSAGGGFNPAWSVDGRTLHYLGGNPAARGQYFAVDIVATVALEAGTPRVLFRLPSLQGCAPTRCYDVSADGLRFLFRTEQAPQRTDVTRMDLVLNWTATLPKGQ